MLHLRTHAHANTHTRAHTYDTHVYTIKCVCVCVCVCIYTHTHTGLMFTISHYLSLCMLQAELGAEHSSNTLHIMFASGDFVLSTVAEKKIIA